jgi:hypothetical protein
LLVEFLKIHSLVAGLHTIQLTRPHQSPQCLDFIVGMDKEVGPIFTFNRALKTLLVMHPLCQILCNFSKDWAMKNPLCVHST